MSGQLHWWLVAVSFGLGMVLTFALMMRPARVQMPAWVYPEPAPTPAPSPEPPVMKVADSEAPTQRIPVARPRPVKKAVGKAPPKKRRSVPEDTATERIPVPRKRPAKKLPAKKLPAKKVRPKDPARRVAGTKDVATEKIPTAKAAEPLKPYAPYGPGSMRADSDGSGPQGWPVKGRTDSRLFYCPDDPGYDEIDAQVWFENQDFATRAFFTPGRNSARTAD